MLVVLLRDPPVARLASLQASCFASKHHSSANPPALHLFLVALRAPAQVFDGHGGANAASFARNRILHLLRGHLLQLQMAQNSRDKDGVATGGRRGGKAGGKGDGAEGDGNAERAGEPDAPPAPDGAADRVSGCSHSGTDVPSAGAGDGADGRSVESDAVLADGSDPAARGGAGDSGAGGEPQDGASAADWLKEQLPAALARAFLSCHNDFAKSE